MPEIATLAGLERLDMMLNDSMYGILFRDINPIRTFVDQRFSRQIHARAGIIINTGEDNYLTTADAIEAAHTVTTSQLLNEYFAKEAGLEDWQLGLGHAFEIDPEVPDSFRLELAHAMLARELFPDAPLKWMPPTRHMTGDIFKGYLLDGFFNLVGALTGQGILLVGMMTEAVVTPWISDRDLALQNVRYVMNAAGKLHEDFRPAPDGFIANRAREVLGEAVDLLEEIKADRTVKGQPPLLSAIADGTFGLMKRPPHKGRGLDGVARKAADYYNPATEILEDEVSLIRPYGDTTGDGMVQLSFTLPIEHSKVAEGAAVQLANKMGMDPALVVHAKPMGEGFTFFVVYGRVNHLVDPSTVEVVERDYPLLTPKEANAAIKRSLRRRLVVVGGCIGTDAHTVGIDAILNIKGFAGEKGLEYYRELKVVNLGAQVSVPQLVEAAREERADAVLVSQVVTQRDAHLLNTREMSAAFREAYPAATRPLLVVGGPRFDETMSAELGVDRVFTRGTTPGEVASFIVHRLTSPRTPHHHGEGLMSESTRVGTVITHRRYVPYSHAHYAGNLVDGAYSLGLFGDVATEMCIVLDGDEGLFASYSDVQFRAPVRAGDVLEITATLVREGTAAGSWTSRSTSSGGVRRPTPHPAQRTSWTRRWWRRPRPERSSCPRAAG